MEKYCLDGTAVLTIGSFGKFIIIGIGAMIFIALFLIAVAASNNNRKPPSDD